MTGKYGPHGELFFFLIQKEQATAPSNETFSTLINPGVRFPCFSAEVFQKCALIALHVMAEEATGGDGFQVPELGEEWKMGCQNSPVWGERSLVGRRKCVFQWISRRQCVQRCVARRRVVWAWWQDLFLEDRELAKVALSCHVALDLLCQEMHEGWLSGDATERPLCHGMSAVLSPWTGCDS